MGVVNGRAGAALRLAYQKPPFQKPTIPAPRLPRFLPASSSSAKREVSIELKRQI